MEISRKEAFDILDSKDDFRRCGKLVETDIKLCRRIFRAWPSLRGQYPSLKDACKAK